MASITGTEHCARPHRRLGDRCRLHQHVCPRRGARGIDRARHDGRRTRPLGLAVFVDGRVDDGAAAGQGIFRLRLAPADATHPDDPLPYGVYPSADKVPLLISIPETTASSRWPVRRTCSTGRRPRQGSELRRQQGALCAARLRTSRMEMLRRFRRPDLRGARRPLLDSASDRLGEGRAQSAICRSTRRVHAHEIRQRRWSRVSIPALAASLSRPVRSPGQRADDWPAHRAGPPPVRGLMNRTPCRSLGRERATRPVPRGLLPRRRRLRQAYWPVWPALPRSITDPDRHAVPMTRQLVGVAAMLGMGFIAHRLGRLRGLLFALSVAGVVMMGFCQFSYVPRATLLMTGLVWGVVWSPILALYDGVLVKTRPGGLNIVYGRLRLWGVGRLHRRHAVDRRGRRSARPRRRCSSSASPVWLLVPFALVLPRAEPREPGQAHHAPFGLFDLLRNMGRSCCS